MVAPLVGAALVGGAFGLGGSLVQGFMGKSAADDQMGFQRDMYGRRYQMTMADMRAAGLNPILAYRQGAPGSPQGAMYQPPNYGQSAMQGASSAVQMARMGKLIDAEVKAATEKANQEALNTEILEREVPKAAIEEQIWTELWDLWQKHAPTGEDIERISQLLRIIFEGGLQGAEGLAKMGIDLFGNKGSAKTPAHQAPRQPGIPEGSVGDPAYWSPAAIKKRQQLRRRRRSYDKFRKREGARDHHPPLPRKRTPASGTAR